LEGVKTATCSSVKYVESPEIINFKIQPFFIVELLVAQCYLTEDDVNDW